MKKKEVHLSKAVMKQNATAPKQCWEGIKMCYSMQLKRFRQSAWVDKRLRDEQS